MTILEEIIRNKFSEVEKAKKQIQIDDLIKSAKDAKPTPRLIDQLISDSDFHFICEVKKASPSKGIIQPDFNPVRQAGMYERGGASAVSVLTDEKYFMGHLSYLGQIKSEVNLPLLRKDFIIDEYQIYQSRAFGADLILLIARVLEKNQISEYCKLAEDLGLDVLIELAEPEEIDKLPEKANNVILGVNNRDLHTFDVDLKRSLKMRKLLPNYFPLISESGINSVADCRLLKDNGFRGALIGETLMRAENPEELLKEMKHGVADVFKT
jgi:indole-3-glycerol phosphate synthase